MKTQKKTQQKPRTWFGLRYHQERAEVLERQKEQLEDDVTALTIVCQVLVTRISERVNANT